jgi:hypothetical protein
MKKMDCEIENGFGNEEVGWRMTKKGIHGKWPMMHNGVMSWNVP